MRDKYIYKHEYILCIHIYCRLYEHITINLAKKMEGETKESTIYLRSIGMKYIIQQ